MTTRSNRCESKHVELFLNGTLSRSAQATFEEHLDECEECRESLDRAVASERDWKEVRYSLSTEGPASTLMIVSGFTRPEFLVEVEAIAAEEN